MAIGEGAKVREKYVPYARIVEALGDRVVRADAVREADRGPAKYLVARHDPSLRVGFITGHSDTYCSGCDRLRVSADGTFRPCLATNDGVSAAAEARAGDAAGVTARLHEAWEKKPDGTTFRGCSEASAADVSIRAIGG
jgi:cyclic pyranopterin phosphate synthase